MRVIIYTGKGGAGKTSVAAATACRLAEDGKKVLIMSTDQAHSLGDSFDRKIGGEIVNIAENLDALEIDAVKESEDAWGHMQNYLKRVLTARAEGGIEVEELLVFPGLEELFSLFKILDISEEKKYDALIVDCAPTGETLALLKFPEMFGALLEKMLPLKRKTVKVAGPAVEKVTKIPMPQDEVFAELEKLMDKLERLQELMLNKDVLSIRIVTTPEKIVVKEAKRSFTCLHLYDYNVDAVIVNKVYPDEALEGYFSKWAGLQKEGLAEIAEGFPGIPRFRLMLQKREIRSLQVLREVSGLYGSADPFDVFHKEKIFKMSRDEENRWKMEISLPHALKEEMDLSQKGGEICISVKNEKRCFVLPDCVRGAEISGAKLEDGRLQITFE